LAMRQHALGPYPLDPNLIAQGIPPDDRVTFGDNIFGPVEGTPLPPGAVPSGSPPGPPSPPAAPPTPESAVPPPAPAAAASPAAGPGGAAAPASAKSSSVRGPAPGPSVALAQYNPLTGQYATPDGQIFTQTDLVAPHAARTWKDFFPT
jgi:phospholipid/cholesterol/gamma-HCH transport system substrate-binding protein